MDGIELGDLIQLFNEAFPILPASEEGEPEKSLRQFYAEEIGLIQIIREPLGEWAQGDLMEPLPFIDWTDEGEAVFFEAPGMIMSSTCDLDRKESIAVCPCFMLSDLKDLSAYKDISKNTIFDFLFLGQCLNGDDWVVDLSRPMNLPRHRIQHQIEQGNVSRKHSLTDKGWYLFITKFAIKYLRPDDFGTMSQR